MIKKHFKTLFFLFPLTPLILTTFIVVSSASNGNLFGPKKYKRTSGPPNQYTDTFKARGGNGRLVIVNGDADGNDRITSAAIYLNGKEIFDHDDFKKNVSILEKHVHLNKGSNTLNVGLRGKPGSHITVKVTGTVIPPPAVSIMADPQNILLGASSTLTWISTNADTCFIDQGVGVVPTGGNIAVKPLQTTTYKITATGIGGTQTANVTVNVSNPSNPPYVTISAIQNEITPGGFANLSWSSNGGQSAFIDNGVGVVALNGTVTVNPVNTTIYTISVTGPGGSVSAEAVVTVRGSAAPPPAGSFGEKYGEFIPKDATIPAYDAKRFSMVTGLVQNISGAPLSGVTVFFHDRPEYGTAMTGENGRFSIPIDGGTTMTMTYKKQGLITAQRQVNVPWNGYAVTETVKMISEDSVSTTFTFDGNPATVKTHQSTIHTDSFGSRATTIVFTGDNQAYLTDKDGNPGQALRTITTRATEFTTPDSMPAILPTNSAYTFCTELTVDGVSRVKFQKPVVMWVENFLGFLVGSAVPVGYYDRDKGVWMPSTNGKVVRLLDTNGDGIVDSIDATGNGQPTDLNSNGTFSDEAIGLNDRSKYLPGSTYWRVEVAHFSPWDCNWPFGPPPDAIPPNPNGPPDTDSNPVDKDDTCKTSSGSYAEDRSRTVHEDIPISGTDMTLHYSSKRVKGYKYTFNVPASGGTVPASLKNIHVRVEVAGKIFEQVLPRQPNQKAEFLWDGLDVWGKRVIGSVNANISIGFEYGAFYYGVDANTNSRAFAQAGINSTNIGSRQNIFSWINKAMNISFPPAADMSWSHIAEGWTISMHHYLNPNNPSPLFRGDGSTNTNNVYIITTVAGNEPGDWVDLGDGGPALLAKLRSPMDIALDAKGNLYILDSGHHVIRKVDTNGIITTVAGRPWEWGYRGDGGPAVDALLWLSYGGLSVDAAGNIYFSDYYNSRIRKVDSNGIITTHAEIGISDDITLDPFGNLYVLTKGSYPYFYIRKVDTNRIISHITGISDGNWRWCNNCPAVNSGILVPDAIALDSKGNLYLNERALNLIRKVDTTGMISTVAGMGYEYPGYTVNDGPALSTPITPVTLAADSFGNLYFFNYYTYSLHKLDTNGTVIKIAGNGSPGYSGDGGPAINAQLQFGSIAVNAQGDIYFSDYVHNVVRKVALALSHTDAGGDIHFTDDNGLAHIFSNTGLHKQSVDINTGVVLKEFGYNSNNQLISITDQFGQQVLINRDGNGTVASITSPDGITTNLSIDANKHLKNISYPAGQTYSFGYTSDGLLTAKTEPNGNQFGHSFDSSGRLMVAGDEEGGNWQFNRISYENGDIVSTVTTGEGNVTQYRDHTYATGAVNSVITDSTGAKATYFRSSDGFTVNKSLSCGMNVSFKYDLDPQYKIKIIKEIIRNTPSVLQQSTTFNKTYTDTNSDGVIDRITETIMQNSKAFIFEQDTLLSQKTMVSPTGKIFTSFYNPVNLLTTRLTVPKFYDTNYGYDNKGRLTTLNRNTRTTNFSYNLQGFLGSITDPENKTVSYVYDVIGRLTQINRPDGTSIGFSYDANGNTTVVRTPSAINHGFDYNKVNLNSAYATPLSGVYSYVYNKDKQLKQIIFPSGHLINTIYSSGNIAQMQTPEGNIDYTYLCGSKIGSITKDSESIAFAYDGNLLTSSTLSGTLNKTLAYGFNNDFIPTSFSYAGGTTNYAYDNDGLLTGVGVFTIARDTQNGLPQSVVDGTLTLNRTFNGYGEQTAETYNIVGRNVTIWNLTYTDAGQIKTKTEMVDGIAANYIYTYDLMNRLTSVNKNGDTVEQYQYGFNGARISEVNALRGISRNLSYSNEDHLVTAGNTTYQYDVDGFLQQRNQNGALTIYHYSSRGELLKVELPDGKFIEYIHDPLGRRVAAKVNGAVTEKYLWQGQTTGQTRLLAIYNGSDNLLMRFDYADGRMPYSMTSGGNTYYLTYDQVGSLRVITDKNGNTVKMIDYDSFGNIITDTNPQFNVMFGFAGGLHDPDTGLVRFGYRDYNPDTGRWTAKDPILFAGGNTDLYGYVTNDPINYSDPSGLWRSHPRYGNWGGEGWSGGKSGKELPIDSMDECYQEHDQCYDDLSRGGACSTRSKCDKDLASCLYRLAKNPFNWKRPAPNPIYAAFYRTWALGYFQFQY